MRFITRYGNTVGGLDGPTPASASYPGTKGYHPCAPCGKSQPSEDTPRSVRATPSDPKCAARCGTKAARGVLHARPMKLSTCGRFIVLESLHIDRDVLGPLAAWAARRGIGLQDAIQLAVVGFMDLPSVAAPSTSPFPGTEAPPPGPPSSRSSLHRSA